MTAEHTIQKKIQVALSANKCSVFRTNVGKGMLISYNQILGKDRNGNYIVKPPLNYFETGLPKGFPDLMGFRWKDNQMFCIEVKNENGKPRPDQVRFHDFLRMHNAIHGIARSPKDALMIVEGGLVGYGFDD